MSPRPDLRKLEGEWIVFLKKTGLYSDFTFKFLNKTFQIDKNQWDNRKFEKLCYNLHYFDDLNASEAKNRLNQHKQLVNDWIQNNKPGEGTGWEPYPSSLKSLIGSKWTFQYALDERALTVSSSS